MKITLLGTRGMVTPSALHYHKHSGILVSGKLLFDVGEKVFLRHKPKAIFITHLHPDHAFFVEEPVFLSSVPIYAPEQKEFAFIKIAKPVRIGLYRITPLPTEHSARVKSCAYLIEHGKKRILYTGDLVWMQKKYRDQLGKLDCVITEGSFLKEGGMIRKDIKTGKLFGHAGIPNLLRLFKPHTRTVVLAHFGSWFFKDIKQSRALIASLGKKYDVTPIVAHDGMTLTV
ncbi:MAG: MBL fold metallo-hydrolase [Patescibacteria group bacterium]|nr:MBL fold metallo-hydrolase [Patescibacteria group bacterium]